THADRLDPTRRALWSRIRRWMLTQINPSAFRGVLCARVAVSFWQAAAKCFLSECRRCCANQPKKRNGANEHLAAKSTLVRSKLQAMCRLKYCRKNAVNQIGRAH